MLNNNISIYIHWPFCLSKCPYCDFNSHVRDKHEPESWVAAVEVELKYYAKLLPNKQINTIFFGGGTPSLIPPSLVEKIIETVYGLWTSRRDIEITLEANPTSSESQKFKDLVKAGVNRFSLGIQALSNKDLQFLGREHSVQEALKALEAAQKHADRVSFDLIYARPKQKLKEWEVELKNALAFGTKHLSLYQLTIEPGTAFHTRYRAGAFKIPKESLAADFYELTESIMNKAGLPAYEISNYAALGEECRHNQTYWAYEDYVGIGPGAHGRIQTLEKGIYRRIATQNHRAPELWLKAVHEKGQGMKIQETLNIKDQIVEKLMMGLRTVKGVVVEEVLTVNKGFSQNVQTLCKEGYLVRKEGRLRPTFKGRLCLNSVLGYLLAPLSDEDCLEDSLEGGFIPAASL